jgi:hypothetical protein
VKEQQYTKEPKGKKEKHKERLITERRKSIPEDLVDFSSRCN